MSYPLVTPGGFGLGYVKNPNNPTPPELSLLKSPDFSLPAVVDLRPAFQPAFDQGQYGTCTCNGAASQLEYELVRQRVPVYRRRSRTFPYFYSGQLEGGTGDTGRDPQDVFKAINLHGDCPESDWPYYPTVAVGQEPSAAAQLAAERRKFATWYNVPQFVPSIQQALAFGYSVGIAFTVFSSFESAQTLSTGLVPLPLPGEQVLGGHYMVIGGYTDIDLPEGIPARHFMVLNSWGQSIGHKGWMFFPYEFINHYDPTGQLLVSELIALELVTQ